MIVISLVVVFPFSGSSKTGEASESSSAAQSYGVPMSAKHVKALCDTDYKQALGLKWARALAHHFGQH